MRATWLLAVPALAAGWLRLGPGAGFWLAVAVLAVVLSLAAARWRRPSPGAGGLVAALGRLALGALGCMAVAIAWAAGRAEELPFDEARARQILDLDAAVATRPLPRCAPRPRSSRVLLERGARPRLGADARTLWFDAAHDGARQVQRLDRQSGEVVCWTCGEPGDNWRPHPGLGGASVVFETDRHATWRDPLDTEIHLIDARGEAPRRGSRRLTVSPGPDDHAVLAPRAPIVLWSRRDDGRYRVLAAAIRTGHGSLSLGRPTVLDDAGAAWTAPLAWSPDARALALVRGNPLRPLAASSLDLGDGRETPLGPAVPGGIDFSADGGWMVVAGAGPRGVAGWLPAPLGGVLAPWATWRAREGALYRGTRLGVGEPRGERRELEIGAIAGWGEPTGVALAPDGSWLVLGQRRGAQERLLEIELDCSGPPS